MDLVTLKIFNTEVEAELVKLYLESEGVEAFVFGNILANTYNLFNTTSGGVQLKVSEETFEEAQKLVEAYFNENTTD